MRPPCNTCHRRPAKKDRRECACCYQRRWRAANPYQAAYAVCKAKAKQRKTKQWPNGIPWEISYQEFVVFARETEYITQKGNEAGSLTIDRIDCRKGYVSDNIQPMSRIKNVEKQCREQGYRFEAGYAWRSRY